MKKRVIMALSMGVMLLLAGCGAANKNAGDGTSPINTVAEESSVEEKDTTESTAAEEAVVETEEKDDGETQVGDDTVKKAVVYFSATGNTKVIAEYIADLENADIMEIEPENPYTAEDLNYNDSSCRANQEMNDDSARPAIKNDMSAVLDYDVIYLGYPIWWGVEPRIIQTFLDTYDLSGKTVYAFCTSGSSDIDRSVSDITEKYNGITIAGSRRFDGEDGQEIVENWLDGLQE